MILQAFLDVLNQIVCSEALALFIRLIGYTTGRCVESIFLPHDKVEMNNTSTVIYRQIFIRKYYTIQILISNSIFNQVDHSWHRLSDPGWTSLEISGGDGTSTLH